MAENVKLAYLVSHPIQYQVPLLRRIAALQNVTLKVFFCSDFSLRAFHDPEFGHAVQWDVPLLDGYNYEFLPTIGRTDKPNFLRPLVYGIADRLKKGRYDFLWVQGWAHWSRLWAIVVGHRIGIKVLLWGDTNPRKPAGGVLKRALKRQFMRWLFRRVDAFLAIGSLNREFYRSHGVDPSRIFTFPFAVDNDYFQERTREARATREALRRSLGLQSAIPVILYASKLTAGKRPQDLLEAYVRLSMDRQQDPVAYLLYVGDGEMRASLEARVADLGLRTIQFLGFKNQSELPAYYDLCDVLVLPSAAEAWGLVVNEAMNAGRAVIVSDEVGCGPDLVEDGVTGFVVPAGDTASLAERLRRLITEPSLAQSMGERGRERIVRWSYEQAIEGILQCLDTLGRRQDVA